MAPQRISPLVPGVERFDPPAEAVEGAPRLARLARLAIGGIEYLTDDRDGVIRFRDINALSNFVADAGNVLGFDPTARFVGHLESPFARARGFEAASAR